MPPKADPNEIKIRIFQLQLNNRWMSFVVNCLQVIMDGWMHMRLTTLSVDIQKLYITFQKYLINFLPFSLFENHRW